MSLKRISQTNETTLTSQPKNPRREDYFKSTLKDCGLLIKHPPVKCVTTVEVVVLIRNIKKALQQHVDYPQNVSKFYSSLAEECKDINIFRYYLFPNIVRSTDDSEISVSDSVIRILLNIPILQNKLVNYVFELAIDLAAESKCASWIRMILKCFSGLDNIVDGEKIATHIINLLDVTMEKIVKLEIVTAIPDIIGDQEHDNIATEISRIMSEDHDLIPAILDCLSYLCLSEEQYERLQKRTLNILTVLSKCHHFPNFVKFLLMPGSKDNNVYKEAVHGLRNALGWPSSISKPQDIATSQILTASAIRNSIISSKLVANCWMKAISGCKINADHKAIDFIILLIFFSVSEEKQKQAENVLKKQIKLNILRVDLIDEVFENFIPILKEYIKHLINLTNSLLKNSTEPMLQTFSSHIYMLMFSKLLDCSQTVVAELLQLGLTNKNCLLSILSILNSVAENDISLLKPQSIQMLMLLDRTDDMSLSEIKAVMNLVCGLAYSFENSVIRDDIHMIIRKELGSSNLQIKTQGILAGTHAVKYLIKSTIDENDVAEPPEDVTYGSISHFPEGDLHEAAQIIELINRSTRRFPNMITLFYDELSNIITTLPSISKQFLAWIADAVTNDLQHNFIVDNIECDRIGDIKLGMQYCLNTDSEMDEMIAINIGGLILQEKDDVNIFMLPPLFHAVQILHKKKYESDLSSIDALLGCPVVMPIFDVDSIEDMSNPAVINILDCLVHCSNWFRELINAFASQSDLGLRSKIFLRIMHIHKIETIINQILLKINFKYTPPSYLINFKGNIGEKSVPKALNSKPANNKKKHNQDDSVLPETGRTQATQNNLRSIQNKIGVMDNAFFRSLDLSLLDLLNAELVGDNEADTGLTTEILVFILQYVNSNLEKVLLSKIKRNNFLSKEDNVEMYNSSKAEECARKVHDVLPKVVEHLKFVIAHLDNHLHTNSQNELISYPPEMHRYVLCLEYIYNLFTIYFRWIGFKNQNIALLKSSLRTIFNVDNDNSVSLKDLVFAVAKYVQKHEKYCVQISSAVALLEFLNIIKDFSASSSTTVSKIQRELANNFLSQSWQTLDGILEKGLAFNQNLDIIAKVFFINNEVLSLKNISLLLVNEIEALKSRNNTLNTFKCINKANFPVIYRNLGTALQDVTKSRLNKGLTNNEHLELWKDVAIILRCMSEISKTLENRNNLTAFFKKTLPMIKLFISQGIPILELEFKSRTQEILEILKILQQTTRFLQSLCCHSRLKKDTALMSKVPDMRQQLETLIYKVKAVLTANKCSEAFWMGNLKNKNIHGEIIASQESVETEESVEDCDEQLPDDSDNTDDEMLDPDSKSLSDIV
ncbi:Fanconi anemia group D2 protein [Aricia agestis]|uniref:Fanconi anemia group D2 protein n=1 Tax=Aricia agestis TaxID=91739 RepID=UPI001C203C47|nr:Fanconi anemia group D2 protein [Aricia agestis]